MDARRIAELLEPFLGPANDRRLTTSDLSHISTYIDLLLHWNARINLTAIRDEEEIVTRHFGESLFAARHLFPRSLSFRPECAGERSDPTHVVGGPCVSVGPSVSPAVKSIDFPSGPGSARESQWPKTQDSGPANRLSLADVGSGPGFPGLPIKLWAPEISLTLIESNHKKATFLREVTRALTLTDVNIQTARAESLPAATFDVVTLRAVDRFHHILPTAAALVRPQGRLALLIGIGQVDQARLTLPTLAWSAPIPIPHSKSRVLLITDQCDP